PCSPPFPYTPLFRPRLSLFSRHIPYDHGYKLPTNPQSPNRNQQRKNMRKVATYGLKSSGSFGYTNGLSSSTVMRFMLGSLAILRSEEHTSELQSREN